MTILAPRRVLSLAERIGCAWKYRQFSHAGWVHHVHALENVETGLPKTIEPHGAHSIYIDEEVISDVLAVDDPLTFAISVQDAHWKSRISEPFKWHKRKKKASAL